MKFYGLRNKKTGDWMQSPDGIILWGPRGVADAYYDRLNERDKKRFEITEFA